ncbi:MAG: ATP-binding protein [Ignavibacteria bacterium]|nr:ATP-binding protein [Ignavibacteria bacterium]
MASVIDQVLQICKFSELKNHIDNFLEEFVCRVRKVLNSEYCEAALYDKKTKELYYHFGCGRGDKLTKKEYQDFFRTKLWGDLAGNSPTQNKTLNLTKKFITPDITKIFNDRLGITVKSILVTPMLSRGELVGVILAVNKKDKQKFSKYDEKLIRIFASQAALMIDNSRLFEENVTKERLSHLGQSIIDSAHGLKNILNNMDGGAYIVELGTITKNMKEVNKGWDILKRNSNRLRDLVLDILFFSRPKKPEYKLTDINNICKDIKELIEQSARESNVKINLDLNSSINLYCLDPKGIYRCILNLVSNSIYSCQEKEGGEVSIKTFLDKEGNLKIVVSDNGTGISKENLDHIFDIFFTTKGSKGTGLGLAVTKKIINEHLGTIAVISELGTGSSFTITLPKNRSRDCHQKSK